MLDAHEQFLKMKSRGLFTTGRSTLSPSSAALVKPYFDEMLRTGKEVELRCDVFGVAKGTLYRRILDGIRYLIQRDKPGSEGALCKNLAEQQQYLGLKHLWKIEETDAGFLIHPNRLEIQNRGLQQQLAKHKAYINSVLGTTQQQQANVNWRDDFELFITTAPAESEFCREGLSLNNEDRAYIANLCEQIGAGFDIPEDGTKLTVVKP